MAKLVKGFRGFVNDDPNTIQWADQIGRMLLNFGTVELQVFFWLETLSDDSEEVIKASKIQFSQRLHRVIKLVKQKGFNKEDEEKILEILRHTEELSKFRNSIAHNPLLFSWVGREPDGKPDNIGVPSFRKSKSDNTAFTIVPLCSLEKLKRAVDAVHENANNLAETFEDLISTNA